MPSAIPSDNAAIAIWLEGDSDVWAIESFARMLEQAGLLPQPLATDKMFFVFGGGGDQLKSFVNGEYLNALGLPQFYLRDSDKEAKDHPGKAIPKDVSDRVDKWNNDREGLPIAVMMTRKREIENYLHPDAIGRVLGVERQLVDQHLSFDMDFADLSKVGTDFWRGISKIKDETGARFPERICRGVSLKHLKPKHMICGIILPEMSLEEIRERCGSTDPEGTKCCEIEAWFKQMAELIEAHA